MRKITVIAEIGINHQGNMDTAKAMIRKAAQAGADIAKFQWYDPVKVLGNDHPCLQEAADAQFDWQQHAELKRFCDEIGIEWCVSIFHEEQIKIVEDLGIKRYKIASRAALDNILLAAVAKTRKPVIVSTGRCDDRHLFSIMRTFGKDSPMTMLYCVADYPTMLSRINLDKMPLLRRYAPTVGFSSHCPKIAPTVAAAARGAVVVENHVVLDREQKGCDVSSSLEFREFSQMVSIIRDLEGMC